MCIPFEYTKKTAQKGFTLVEIMIVVFIIGILSVAAIMTLGRGTTSERARDSALELKSLLSAAEQEALLSQSQVGILFHDKGYSFAKFDTKKQAWQRLEKDRSLGTAHRLPHDVELVVTVEGHDITPATSSSSQNPSPQLVVSPQGNQAPFAVGVSHKGTMQYWLVGHANGAIEIVDASGE